jgi:ribosomal RNA small subunit methyltransferase G
LPGLSDKRAVLVIKKERTTPKAYPRKAGKPAKEPLL